MTSHEQHSEATVPGHSLLPVSPDLVRLIWRRKWHLISCLLISLALGAAYLTQAEPSYRVQARILVQQQGLPLETDRASTDTDEFTATQAEIIHSPAVVERAIKALHVPLRVEPPMTPITFVLDRLSVMPVPGTNVLSIGFDGSSPREATRMVEAIIFGYREYLHGADQDTYLEVLRMLTQREAELREEIGIQQAQYQQLRKDSPLMGQGDDATDVQRSLLTNLGERLTEVKNQRMEIENRVRTIRIGQEPSLVSLTSKRPFVMTTAAVSSNSVTNNMDFRAAAERLDDADTDWDRQAPRQKVLLHVSSEGWGISGMEAIQEQLGAAQAEEKAISQHYGHRHPEILRARERISAWRQRLRESIDAAPAVLQQELTAARFHEQQLGELYQEECGKAKRIDVHLVQEQQSLDSLQRLQTLHDSVLTQLTELKMADQALAEGRSGVKVGTLEAPDTPERLLFPPPALLMAVCGLVGLMGGLGMVTMLEHHGDENEKQRKPRHSSKEH